jgi:hypothetical protein
MVDETSKTRLKRLPKGQRIHVQRLKQAARKAGTAYSQPVYCVRQVHSRRRLNTSQARKG